MIINNIASINKEFEYTIIGSGPASLTLALELEENKIPCLILEAGEFENNKKSKDFLKGYKGGDQSYLGLLHEARSRVFGGTSDQWSGLSKPLDEQDFVEWPIKKKDLEIYFEKAAYILELKSKFKSDVILNENIRQVEYEYSNQENYNFEKNDTSPVRFGKKYKDRITKSKYIHLAINTPMIRVVGKDKNATHVVIKNNNSDLHLPVKNLIIGCGGYENARILLWSQEKSNTSFLKNLPFGEFFNVHPGWLVGRGIARMDKLNEIFSNDIKSPMYKGAYILSPTNKMMIEKNINNIAIRIYGYDHHDDYMEILREILCVAPKYGKKIAELAKQKIICQNITFSAVSEQEAIQENKITLSKNNFDDYGVPRIHMQFHLQNTVRKTMSTFMEEIGKYFISKDLGRIKIEDWLYDFSKDFSEYGKADNGCHHIGSTRMGTDPQTSVTDQNLKIHNTNNVYVIGTSVFSSGGAVNPTLTICQLSLKLANHLKSLKFT